MYFESLIKFMKDFLDEQGFKARGEGVFASEEREIKIAYNEQAKMYELFNKKDEEFVRISAYLFDESQSERDTESVAIDFVDTLRTVFGIKKTVSASNVALPKDAEDSDKVTTVGLTQKLLAIFPEYKDVYKQHVADNGKFMLVEFYHENFIPAVRELLREGSKKQVKKFYDAMSDIFIAADSATVPFVVGVIASAVYDSPECLETAHEHTADKSGFFTQIYNLANNMKHNKKLRETF